MEWRVAAMPVTDIVIATTLILGIGSLAVSRARAPAYQQRFAELAVIATLAWIVAALVPLPRPDLLPFAFEDRSSARAGEVRSGIPSADVLSGASEIDASSPATAPADAGGVDSRGSASIDSSPHRTDGRIDVRGFARSDSRVIDSAGTGFLDWLAVGYGAVSLFLLGHVVAGVFLVRRLVRKSEPAPAWLDRLFEERQREREIVRGRLRVTHSTRRPLLAGIRTPTILIPLRLVDREKVTELGCVIDHELVHVRRNDVASRTLFAIAGVVLWPHPLYWWLRNRAALAAEMLADDGAHRGDRHAYARVLLALAGELNSLTPAPGFAPGAFRNRSELTRRIEMLLSQKNRLVTSCTRRHRVAQLVTTAVILGASIGLFGARALPAEEPATPVQGDLAKQARTQESLVDVPDVPDLSSQGVQLHNDSETDDVLALVDRVLNLRNDLELAKMEAVDAERRHQIGELSDMTLRRAQLQVLGLERRLQAILIMVDAEIQAAGIELSEIQRAIDAGTAHTSERSHIVRLTARLKVLESIR